MWYEAGIEEKGACRGAARTMKTASRSRVATKMPTAAKSPRKLPRPARVQPDARVRAEGCSVRVVVGITAFWGSRAYRGNPAQGHQPFG